MPSSRALSLNSTSTIKAKAGQSIRITGQFIASLNLPIPVGGSSSKYYGSSTSLSIIGPFDEDFSVNVQTGETYVSFYLASTGDLESFNTKTIIDSDKSKMLGSTSLSTRIRAQAGRVINKPNGQSLTKGSIQSQTWQSKWAIPADVDRIGIMLWHLDNSNGLVGVRACHAVTETFYEHGAGVDATDISNRKFHPYFNRTGFRTLDDVTSLYGWKSMTWAGAVSPVLAAPLASSNAGATSAVGTFSISDMVDLPPCPAHPADISAGGDASFRYWMARVFIPGSAVNKYAFSPFMESTVKSKLNMGLVQRFSQAGGDLVTTSIGSSTGETAPPNASLPIALVYNSKKYGRMHALFGDSTRQGQGSPVSDEQYNPWLVRACTGYIGNSIFTPLNFGCSGLKFNDYFSCALVNIPLLKPYSAELQCASTNDGPWATLLDAQKYFQMTFGKCQEFVEICSLNGVIPILGTMMPCSSGTIPSSALGKSIDNLRVAHNARCIAYCNSIGIPYFDPDGLINDGGTVDAFGVYRIKSQLTNDSIHQNEAGTKLFAQEYISNVLPLID